MKILESETLIASDGSTWNDPIDARRFNAPYDSWKHFGISFSWLSVENVAMWMLYGGHDVDGAMIDFPQSLPQFVQDNIDTMEFGHFRDGDFVPIETRLPGPDVEVRLVDVAYIVDGSMGEKPDYAALRIRNIPRFEILKETLSSDSASLFCAKSAPWFYETESRLVVSAKKSLFRYPHEITHARLSFPGLSEFVRGRLVRSPLVSEGQSIASGFKRSSLSGEVSWDLCAGCRHRMEVGVQNGQSE
ncbi:hypothetical protein [Collinsella sp. An307]|uniref:hypothetical protein n=1 Tax=Collinsella sp. An307 TaxID=1965630 RepID=UPI00117FDDB7|nr:hypothetical protein [Collinsella sp. An307]